jgi:hypothetical protein
MPLVGSSASGRPLVAIDPRGKVIMAWQRSDGSSHQLRIGTRLATLELSPIETVAEVPADEADFAAQLATDPEGNAVVVWQESVGSSWRINARTRSASGTLGATQTLSPAGQDAFEPRVAVDASGTALIVWRWFDGSNYRIQFARLSVSGS